MDFIIAGINLEEPLPLISISLWNILLAVMVLIIGIILVRRTLINSLFFFFGCIIA